MYNMQIVCWYGHVVYCLVQVQETYLPKSTLVENYDFESGID